ncbi:MAG: type IV pilus biogenesis/stability protein PilW [Gallionella sp.]|nr:type IV pilus biogenesis/stability protein PilW [Gallionella sp.]
MKKLMLSFLSIVAFMVITVQQAGASEPMSRATESAKVHTELAGLYYERSQIGIALAEVDAALQADKNYAPAYYVRGLLHMALREDKEAEDDFLQSLRLDKNDSEAHNNYGWFLCQRDRAKESIPHFMAALKNPLYDTPERAYLNAGLCSMKMGELKHAQDFFDRAMVLQPGMPMALLGMAEMSFANGEFKVAKGYFTRYAQKSDTMTAEQLWLGVRIERSAGDRNAAESYGMQLRKRYPDARETQLFIYGE